jgi:hypothetical protein
MACPNFKKGLKMVSGPLGVKDKNEKTYTKQLESSFLCQIFVLGTSASTIAFI